MSVSRIAMLLAAALLAGCVAVFPRTAALNNVHDAYRFEFAASPLATPSANPCTDIKLEDPFPRTRAEIGAYRAAYGSDGAEAAHLTVLEGMIYLQTTQLGLAELKKDEVAAAAPKLNSGTGVKVRDALFAETYGYLVTGWRAICNANDRTSAKDVRDLDEAAGGIQNILKRYSDRDKLASVDADQGALYLMATALKFRMNQLVHTRNVCGLTGGEGLIDCSTAPASARAELQGAVCQMASMLNEDERSFAVLEKINVQGSHGRLRYVAVYRDAFLQAGRPVCGA